MAHTILAQSNKLKSGSVSLMIGIILIIVGLLAFIPNPLVGQNGLFLTNGAHDIVHLVSGIALLIAGFIDERIALRTIQTFGVIYWLIAVIGLFMGSGMLLWFIAINGWDNLLHIVISAIVSYLGFVLLSKK